MISVNDKWEVEARPGMTVRDVVAAVGFTHRVVVVSRNGQLVPPADYATQTVADGDSIRVIHIVGGG